MNALLTLLLLGLALGLASSLWQNRRLKRELAYAEQGQDDAHAFAACCYQRAVAAEAALLAQEKVGASVRFVRVPSQEDLERGWW